MRDVEQLFLKRMNASWVRGIQMFMKIISNQGAPIVGFGLLLATSYAYATFLKTMPPTFPAALVLAFLVALVLTQSGVRTFMKEADLVFLLPAETRMAGYFRYGLLYSMLIQGVLTLLVMGATYPLFRATLGDDRLFWASTWVVVLLKLWNVYAHWRELLASGSMTLSKFLRFWSNFLLVYALVTQAWWYLVAAALVPVLLTLYLYKRRQGHGYPWSELLAAEQKKLGTYYTWANYFIDVPQVKNQIKKREWLIRIVQRFQADRRQPFLFLYARTFFRYSEYFGMYIRLMIFFAVILLIAKNVWVALGVYLLGIFLMGFQLPMLGAERRYPVLMQIYPLTQGQKEQGISLLALGLLSVQSLLLILPSLLVGLPLQSVLLMLVAGVALSYYMSHIYLPKRFLRESTEDDE